MSKQPEDLHFEDCDDCDGDGYQEKFNDDQSDVITWLCPKCNGTGTVKTRTPLKEIL